MFPYDKRKSSVVGKVHWIFGWWLSKTVVRL